MLCSHLGHAGTAFHIHSRQPPLELCGVGGDEHFNLEEIIPPSRVDSFRVIFLYRNPIDVIYSRFINPEKVEEFAIDHSPASHQKNIQCEGTWSLEEVIEARTDLYQLEQFFDNYTTPDPGRNYTIYAVKYEELFSQLPDLHLTLGIKPPPSRLERKERQKEDFYREELEVIYSGLISKMKSLPFITQF